MPKAWLRRLSKWPLFSADIGLLLGEVRKCSVFCCACGIPVPQCAPGVGDFESDVGISWRRLCTRAEMGPDSIRFWVLFFDQNGNLNRDRKGAPNLGTIFGSKNGDLFSYRVALLSFHGDPKKYFFWVPKSGAKRVPVSRCTCSPCGLSGCGTPWLLTTMWSSLI